MTSTLTAMTRTMDQIPLVDDWAGATRMFNPVFGEGSAIAPPVVFDVDPAGVVHGSRVLGPAREGPPGHAHGGITDLLLDQAVGAWSPPEVAPG